MSESDGEAIYRVAVRRALARGEPGAIQLHFQVEVLDRYLEGGGYSVIRTDTVGRVHKQGGWSLDFGISPDESLLHLAVGELLNLPETEREHWAGFVAILPSSKMFLQMRLAPAACYDDGEVRPWQ